MDELTVIPDHIKTLAVLFTDKSDFRDTHIFGLFSFLCNKVVSVQTSSGTTGKAKRIIDNRTMS